MLQRLPKHATPGKMTHSILEEDHPYIYVDSCMQMWPDGDFHLAHRHGVTAYAVTAWRPPADSAPALQGLMHWHGLAREHEGLGFLRDPATQSWLLTHRGGLDEEHLWQRRWLAGPIQASR